MTLIIAVTLCVILCGLSALHAYWAFGGLWPATNSPDLIRTVAGIDGVTRGVPKVATLLVSTFLFGAAILSISKWLPLEGEISKLAILGCGALAILFAARGVFGLADGFRKFDMKFGQTEPFIRQNRIFFSPLCLFLALGFFVLTFA